jgi:hypothetical protein
MAGEASVADPDLEPSSFRTALLPITPDPRVPRGSL